jgi:predicted amidophosphoribosyltransferase
MTDVYGRSMKYCSECGAKLPAERAGDALSRATCEHCGAVFLFSPRLAAACIAQWNDRVLLVRRYFADRRRGVLGFLYADIMPFAREGATP